MPKLCPNIRFPHQQDFFPIRSVTKSSTSRFSHENLVEKFKIFGQDFVPIRTALIRPSFMGIGFGSGILLDLVLFADRTNEEPKSHLSILWDIRGLQRFERRVDIFLHTPQKEGG